MSAPGDGATVTAPTGAPSNGTGASGGGHPVVTGVQHAEPGSPFAAAGWRALARAWRT